MNDFTIVIPARYGSQRLPGKPLRDVAGKPLLQHVFERAMECNAAEVLVATDDARIAEVAEGFGASVCMTGSQHRSGTERLAEVSRLRDWDEDVAIVNLQGDEPLMPPELIRQCAGLLDGSGVEMATLASPFATPGEFADPNNVKVIVDRHGDAIYFSRAAIPYSRSPTTDDLALRTALHHHGIYAYRAGVLQRITNAAPSPLEQAEQLEQLRALEMGIRIRVGRPSGRPGPGVDTEADLEKVARLIAASA